MAATSYRLQYTVTAAAYTDAARLHQSVMLRRYRIVAAGIAVVGLAVAFIVDASTGLPIAIFGGLLLATTWMEFVDRWLIGARGRSLIGSTTTYDIDDAGIHYRSQLGTGLIAWSALTVVRSSEKVVVLSRDRVMAAYIPATAFGSRAELETFVAYARSRLGT